MKKKNYEVIEIKLDDLISFQLRLSQSYQGKRLEQLASSIESDGLLDPIIVRPADDGKYEILCGHNRVNAMRKLGRDAIPAKVMEALSDDEAIAIFYDSNLNQQSFNDWNYTQKIQAIQYIDALVKENSQQGKRNDLTEHDAVTEDGTSVHSRHKLGKGSRRSTTRDRMSRRLGIATATLSKYRKIIKLPDNLIDSIARMLDEKKITFAAACTMTGLSNGEIEWLLEDVDESPNKKIDMDRLKEIVAMGKEPSKFRPQSQELIKSILVPRETTGDTRH